MARVRAAAALVHPRIGPSPSAAIVAARSYRAAQA
jgi:hypothetical protein